MVKSEKQVTNDTKLEKSQYPYNQQGQWAIQDNQ